MKSRKMKMRKPSSNEYLPLEVLTQILANLPAKSVLRFRCVCKSWCSVIDDPDFVSMHLQLCNNSRFNSGKLLALEGLGSDGLSGSLLTIRKADTLRKIGHIFKCSRRYHFHGSCNSLILMSCYLTSMRLCNPSIGKSLLLPPCPLLSCLNYDSSVVIRFYDSIVVLGFSLRTKDVKVIVITFYYTVNREIPNICVAVYTLSDQQWAMRDNGLNIDGLSIKHLVGPYYFCEGAAHWLGKDPYGDSSNQFDYPTNLVSLDFDTENFTFFELPLALDDEVDTTARSLFILGDSLAFFCISAVSFRIWVLKQKSGKREWTLRFSGRSSSDGFNLFYYRDSRTRVLYHSGEGGSLVCGKKSFNIAACQVRSIGKSMNRDVELETYYESLVLCKGYGVVDMASFPFCLDK